MSLSCRAGTICRWGWAVGVAGVEKTVSWKLGELREQESGGCDGYAPSGSGPRDREHRGPGFSGGYV